MILPHGWRTTTLNELARDGYGFVDGPFGSNLPASDYTLTGVPIIRGSNLSLGEARFRDDEFVFVSHESAKRLERSLCGPEDIIFTKKGTLGQVGFIPKGHRFDCFLVSSNQMKLSVDPRKADPLYVYYYVSSPASRTKIVRDSEATGVPKINLAYLRRFPIDLPPLSEQRTISRLVGALDDKIDLNRRTNETLEGIARAVFKSWFVDFDPVRAKAEGRRPAGMDAETAGAFCSSFHDSPVGRVPRGWRVTTVGNEFSLTMGQSPPGNTYNSVGAGLPFYQGRADFQFRFPEPRVYCSSPTRAANPGDTLISVRALVGSLNMAVEKCCIGRGVAAARHNSGSRSYTYYFMRSMEPEFSEFEAEGTVFGSINKADFHNMGCVSAPQSVVDSFERLVFPLDQEIEVNENQLITLAALRDALVPKLLSGELRIRDAEKMVEAHV